MPRHWAIVTPKTVTVTGTWYTDDTATLTSAGDSVTFTVVGTQTIAAVVAGLVAAWNDSTDDGMTSITASDDSPNIVLTPDEGNVPFAVTTSESVVGTLGGGGLGDAIDKPLVEPVTLEELRSTVRLTEQDDQENADLLAHISSARNYAEEATWRAIPEQTIDLWIDGFQSTIWLPRPPFLSVSSVQYYDQSGDLQTVATTVYETSEDNGVGFIRLKYGQSWPTTLGHPDSVVIRYKAGYGPAASDVPPQLRQKIKKLAADWFMCAGALDVVDRYNQSFAIWRARTWD